MTSSKRRSERKRLSIDGVLDIETADWSQYLLGGLYRHGEYLQKDWKHEGELVDELLSTEGTIWAHNGGRFDFLWFLGHLLNRRVPARVFVSSLGVSTIKVAKLTLRDSMVLVPMSLAKALPLIGETKHQTGYFCKCGRACGGYCSFSRHMGIRMRTELSEYLRADCEQLYRLLRAIQNYADLNDLDLCGTIGASAWATARRWYEIEDEEWTGQTHSFAREAYFGGRCSIIRPKAESAFYYDRHSAYPSAMASCALPTGAKRFLGSTASKSFDKPGIFEAVVDVGEVDFPVLPYRTGTNQKNAKRVGFPTGTFTGVWTGTELRHALDNGVSIQAITRALVWEREEKVLAPFAERIWALRASAANPTLNAWLKLYLNSLSGKLAQKPQAKQVKFAEMPEFCPSNGDCRGILCGTICCKHQCSGKCKPWAKLDMAGHIWTRELHFIHDHSFPHFAAHITADARIELHKQLLSVSEPVYCDTDSVFSVDDQHRNLGEGLGQWRQVDRVTKFQAIAPRRYRYTSSAEGDVVKCRGVPDAKYHWDALVENVQFQIDKGVENFTSAARGPIFFRKKHRLMRSGADGINFGDRKWVGGSSTVPLTVGEFQSLPSEHRQA